MATEGPLPAQILYHQPWTPASFHDDVFADYEDWLETFQTVARFNGWNDDWKLQNVYFGLEVPARTWFQNHEASFTYWGVFCTNLLASFPNSNRRERAEAALHTRSQQPNESVRMYVEDMTRLFKGADPNMAEDKKLRHLMPVVKQELFAGLVHSRPRTVAEFLAEVSTMEHTLQQTARQYNRDVNTFWFSAFSMPLRSDAAVLRDLIRSVVMEVLQNLRMFCTAASFPSLA